ncbi:TPA: alpha/beta hydrolase [Escherichia coli]|nr:alpha/beta hydrolase [Escherichia coli]HAW4335055.1 alpha/beta hydrolase [Escherichia coli]
MHLYYTDSGDNPEKQELPAIIFIHGFFMNQNMFHSQIERLKNKYRIICFDVMGFGNSKFDDDDSSLYDVAHNIVCTLDSLKIKKYIVCGMSMGGYIALRLAIKYHNHLAGLILISTQSEQDPPQNISSYHELCNSWSDKITREKIVNDLLPVFFGEHRKHASEWKEIWMSLNPEIIKKAMSIMTTRDDITSEIKEINVPTLIIHGENDIGIPHEKARTLNKNIVSSQLSLIPDGCHAVSVTHSKVVNEIMFNWLYKCFDKNNISSTL